MKNLTILKKVEGQEIKKITIENDFRAMQKVVGGILGVMPLKNGIDLWYNDEFLFDSDCKENFIVNDILIQGTVLFARHDDEGDTTPLSDADVLYVKNQFVEFPSRVFPVYLNVEEPLVGWFHNEINRLKKKLEVISNEK